MSRVLAMDCPACGHRATVRTSKTVTPLFRELSYQCRDPECSFAWVATLGASRVLAPSAKADAIVNIPLSPHIRRKVIADQLQLVLEVSNG